MRSLQPSDPAEVGPYRPLAELGRGGMGRVLLAAGVNGRLVAVTLVRDQITEQDGFRDRFRREVDAARRVSGAYTAAVVDADPDAPTPWLASVFVPGPTLAEALAATGPLPEEAVLRLAAGQQWTIAADGTLRALGKCLDVAGGVAATGTKVQLYACNGTVAQLWTARDGQLVNTGSGKCLDDPARALDDTQLQIWDCVGDSNQQWQLP